VRFNKGMKKTVDSTLMFVVSFTRDFLSKYVT